MKKLLFCIWIGFCFAYTASAQHQLYKLKYQEAEDMYYNGIYDGNLNTYYNALSKLQEAQNILGRLSPEVLQLRVECRFYILDKVNIYANSSYYEQVEAMRQECQYYLSTYHEVGNDPFLAMAYQKVYDRQKWLNGRGYPSSRQAYNQVIANQQAEVQRQEQARQEERRRQAQEAERQRQEAERQKAEEAEKTRRDALQWEVKKQRYTEVLMYETTNGGSVHGISSYRLGIKNTLYYDGFFDYFAVRGSFRDVKAEETIPKPYFATNGQYVQYFPSQQYLHKKVAELGFGKTFNLIPKFALKEFAPVLSPLYAYVGVGASYDNLFVEYAEYAVPNPNRIWYKPDAVESDGILGRGDAVGFNLEGGVIILPVRFLSLKFGFVRTLYRYTYDKQLPDNYKNAFRNVEFNFAIGLSIKGGGLKRSFWNKDGAEYLD